MPGPPPRSPGSTGRAPARPRAALARSLYVVVVVGALLSLSAWALAATRSASPPATNAVGNTQLADDDAGAALFQLSGLTPGQTESRCITVSHDGAVPDGIRLIGGSGGGGLDAYLHLTVERGSGGRFGDCSDFTGVPVFDGSLGDFVSSHHDYDTGVVASTPVQSGSTIFRLQVTLDDVTAAQGGTATASFAWQARAADIAVEPPAPDPVEDGAPATPRPPAPEPEERPSTATPASVEPDDDRPTPDTPDTPRTAEPQPAPAAPSAPATGGPGPDLGGTLSDPAPPRAKARPPRERSKPAASPTAPRRPAAAPRPAPDDDRGFVETIADAIVPVVQRTAFPLILLILGGLFLLIQNRIDSRDPKLARAPLHAQPDLPFLPPPSPGDVRV